MALYKICPNCGSHLDHGERCDCELLEQRQTKAANAHNKGVSKTEAPTTKAVKNVQSYREMRYPYQWQNTGDKLSAL